jgi:hypothetical protein
VDGSLYLALAARGTPTSTSTSSVSIDGTSLVPGASGVGSNGIPSGGGLHIYKSYSNSDTP